MTLADLPQRVAAALVRVAPGRLHFFAAIVDGETNVRVMPRGDLVAHLRASDLPKLAKELARPSRPGELRVFVAADNGARIASIHFTTSRLAELRRVATTNVTGT